MKNILIVADIYPPEISSAAHLMQEFAEGLAKRGHNVYILTSYPKHYLPKDLIGKKFPVFSEEKGVKIIRVKTLPGKKVNFFVRGIGQLLMPFMFFRILKKYVKSIDNVIVYSPPLPLALVGSMVKNRYNARFTLLLEDIFPQNAIDLNILNPRKHKPAIAFFEWLEKKVYKRADVITFHSEGGRKFLIEKKGIPASKIVAIPNWVDIESYQNLPGNISFRERWGLQGKFILVFAGIMGPAQGMEFIVEVARKIKDIKEAVFLLVGDGMEKGKVENLIAKYNLSNVVIKSFIPKEEYPYLVKDADVGLVCLSSSNKTPFIPGKFLGYMATGKAALAFLNKESDAFALVKEARCGYAVVSDNADKAAEAVKKMHAEGEKLREMGQNGLLYARANLSLGGVLDKFEKLF